VNHQVNSLIDAMSLGRRSRVIEGVRKPDLTGLAHTFRCAFSGTSRAFADLKVCANRIFHSFAAVVAAPSLSPFPSPARAGEGCRGFDVAQPP